MARDASRPTSLSDSIIEQIVFVDDRGNELSRLEARSESTSLLSSQLVSGRQEELLTFEEFLRTLSASYLHNRQQEEKMRMEDVESLPNAIDSLTPSTEEGDLVGGDGDNLNFPSSAESSSRRSLIAVPSSIDSSQVGSDVHVYCLETGNSNNDNKMIGPCRHTNAIASTSSGDEQDDLHNASYSDCLNAVPPTGLRNTHSPKDTNSSSCSNDNNVISEETVNRHLLDAVASPCSSMASADGDDYVETRLMAAGGSDENFLCSTLDTRALVNGLADDDQAGSGSNYADSSSRVAALEEQLRLAQLDIYKKEQKCATLMNMQNKVDSEVHELTGALFQEAYRMVNVAEERSRNAERLLAEARLKVDMLEDEVLGLKRIVVDQNYHHHNIFTTPIKQQFSLSRSALVQRFLNNSLGGGTPKSVDGASSKNKNVTATPPKKLSFFSPSKRSTTVIAANPPTSIATYELSYPSPLNAKQSQQILSPTSCGNELNPIYYKEFTMWRETAGGFDENSAFMRRILCEDIEPCMVFENSEFARQVFEAIKKNTLEMEPLVPQQPQSPSSPDGLSNEGDDEGTASIGRNRRHSSVTASSTHNVRECSLLKIIKVCPYRLRIASDAEWHFVSLLARNRVAAVCDFYTCIRYLHDGIMNTSVNEAYWCVANLRKNMALARLGFHFVLRTNGGTILPSASWTNLSTTPLQSPGSPISSD